MGLILAIFAVRYAVSASLVINPALAQSSAFSMPAGAAYGFLGGLFLARA